MQVRNIIMGLDSQKHTPCGFCFVEFYTHSDAAQAVQWINGAKVDDRPVRVDWDWGFKEGRQFGRGKTGGQIRDDWREDYDPGRGGYGSLYRQQHTKPRGDEGDDNHDDDDDEERRRQRRDRFKRMRDDDGDDVLRKLEDAKRNHEDEHED